MQEQKHVVHCVFYLTWIHAKTHEAVPNEVELEFKQHAKVLHGAVMTRRKRNLVSHGAFRHGKCTAKKSPARTETLELSHARTSVPELGSYTVHMDLRG